MSMSMDIASFVFLQIALGLFATLGWLHGALASMLALVMGRIGRTSLPRAGTEGGE
jgi:hypothetical protein